MSEKLTLIKEIEKQFKALLDVTSMISTNLDKAESTEGLAIIVNSLKIRESAMQQINALQLRLKDAPEDSQETKEYDKHHWLCREMAKKLQSIDQVNMQALNKTLNQLMGNIRSTKQSIKVVKAYHMQSISR